MAGHKWKRLQRATPLPPRKELIDAFVKRTGKSVAEATAELTKIYSEAETWRNDLYQVQVHRDPDNEAIALCIRRVDGYVGRDWRHFQQIKNELVGPECEAVELYPAESRLVDTSNKYHLFCCTDPTFRFPFGWTDRDVSYEPSDVPGMRQAPKMAFATRELSEDDNGAAE